MKIQSLILRTYGMLLEEFGDEENHLLALIKARGVKMNEIVTKDFYDVLKEEGYEVD